jgi:hypothetical protein
VTRASGHRLIFVLALLIPLVSARGGTPAEPPINPAYQAKAASLLNFAQFVEWPKHAFSDEKAPFVFGVLGGNPFGGTLKELVAQEKISGHPTAIQYHTNLNQLRRCHVLYICGSQKPQLGNILKRLKGKNILTVSDIAGFTEAGGMIAFIPDTRVRFRINLAAAKSEDLTISSKLLKLADSIDEKMPAHGR